MNTKTTFFKALIFFVCLFEIYGIATQMVFTYTFNRTPFSESSTDRFAPASKICVASTLTKNGATVGSIARNSINNGTHSATKGVHPFSGIIKTISEPLVKQF